MGRPLAGKGAAGKGAPFPVSPRRCNAPKFLGLLVGSQPDGSGFESPAAHRGHDRLAHISRHTPSPRASRGLRERSGAGDSRSSSVGSGPILSARCRRDRPEVDNHSESECLLAAVPGSNSGGPTLNRSCRPTAGSNWGLVAFWHQPWVPQPSSAALLAAAERPVRWAARGTG
jgi:hypothetical protein